MNPPAAGGQPLGVIWRLDRPDRAQAPAPTLPARFDWVGPEGAAELAQAREADPAAQVALRLAAGRRCRAAWTEGQLAGWGWVSFGAEDVGELGLQLRLRPDEAYIWDCLTVPAFRRRGLYAALLANMAQALQAEGVQTLWIGADYNNAPSQAGIARAGFRAVADLVAAPPQPGERRRLAWLAARPGISAGQLADARRVYWGGRETVWLFSATTP